MEADNTRISIDTNEIAMIQRVERGNGTFENVIVTTKGGFCLYLFTDKYDELLAAMQTSFKLGK